MKHSRTPSLIRRRPHKRPPFITCQVPLFLYLLQPGCCPCTIRYINLKSELEAGNVNGQGLPRIHPGESSSGGSNGCSGVSKAAVTIIISGQHPGFVINAISSASCGARLRGLPMVFSSTVVCYKIFFIWLC